MNKMNKGYEFYFKCGSEILTFPITPSSLEIKIGSKNKTVTLINEGEINILKSPSLVEIKFDARFPMRQYPFAREFQSFDVYWEKLKALKENKKSFRFIVARTTGDGKSTWDTDFLVALEELDLNEDAEEGDDVIISFKLKQYKEYGVKTIKLNNSESSTSTSTSNTNRPNENNGGTAKDYTVKSGDCLWNIAKSFYGDGSKYTTIYNANKTAIEEDARKHGKQSSSNGHWIYPGLKLTIPSVK